MRKSFFTMLALAAGVALSGMTAAPANALPSTKSIATKQQSDVVQVRGGGHGIVIRHGGGHRFGHHHGFRRGIYISPLIGYGYGTGYRSHDNCYWLKRKALNTGSRYWWRRYNACRY